MAYKIMRDDACKSISISGNNKEMEELEMLLCSKNIKFKKESYIQNPPSGMLGYLTQETILSIASIVIPILYQVLSEKRTSRQLSQLKKELKRHVTSLLKSTKKSSHSRRKK